MILRSRTAVIHRSHSPETGVTTVTSNHDVPTVGKPTNDSPDAYSLVNTAQKAVEHQLVDESIPTSQRNIDFQPTSVDSRDAVAPQRDETRNDEVPCQWSDVDLQDIGL